MKLKIRDVVKLIDPLLLFFVLYIPYGLLNSAVLVDWLGCGCPKVDASGEMIHDYFSANDFTRIFWFFIAFWAIASSITLSQTLPKGKLALKVCYVVGISLVSLQIAFILTRIMMWC